MFESAEWEDEPQLSALTWALARGAQAGQVPAAGKKKKKGKPGKETSSEVLKTNGVKIDMNGSKKKKKKDKLSKKGVEPTVEPEKNIVSKKKKKDKLKKEGVQPVVEPLKNGVLMKEKKEDMETGNDEKTNVRKKKKYKSGSLSSLASVSELSSKLSRSLGQGAASPGEAARLLDTSTADQAPSTTSLLTRGIKFSSTASFLRFVGMPARGGKASKREAEVETSEGGEALQGEENGAYKPETPVVQEGGAPERKRARKSLDVERLRSHLAASSPAPGPAAPLSKERRKLAASRFRFLNEQLYTQQGSASASLFKGDPSLFASYHTGYQIQAKQWPLDPLDLIISDIKHMSGKLVVADFGCGEARLAESLSNTVHSFDLVAANERVVACDMAKVPLEDCAVDVAVFCLALMGTNVRDFVFEASRVLRVAGSLKIAELESRFQGGDCNLDKFISDVEKFGFKNTKKDLKKDFFYFLDFEKVQDIKKKKKLPEIVLKPCLYKKR